MKSYLNKMKRIYFFLQFVLLSMTSFATTYYSKTSGSNWNDANGWSTTGYGQSTNTGTYPKSTDVAYVGDGYTLFINTNLSVGTISIGQGTSGTVEFAEGANYTLSILNCLTITNGAKLWYNGTSNRTHTLNIGTNISNSGTLDLYSDADDIVNLVFYRNVNSVITGSGTFDLNVVTINKTSSTSFYVDIQSSGFENAIRDFVVTYGTYNHNNSGTFNVNSGSGSGFIVALDAVIKISQGVVNLSPNQDETTLNGTIIVNGGSLNIGSTAGIAGLRYDKTGSLIPKLDIQSGSMEVYGSICFKSGASADPFNFNMSGGSLKLNSGSTISSTKTFLVNDVTGSSFVINDGIITFQAPNTSGNTVSDFEICGSNGTVSSGGGTIQFGNNSSSSGSVFTFTPVASITLPNIKVTGSNAANITLKPCANSTSNIKALSLYIDQNKTFDMRSVSGSSGDSRSLILTGNMDGINSIISDGNFISRNSLLSFQGTDMQQISGLEVLSLYDLTINNSSGLTLIQEVDIANSLTFTNGILYSTITSPIVLLSGATTNSASASSFVDGVMNQIVATTSSQTISFPIGKDGTYRLTTLDVTHSSSAAVTYSTELFNSSPRNFNYTFPTGVDKVSNVRYFQINRSGPSNLTSLNVSLNYEADDGVNDYQYLRILRDNGSNGWIDAGGVGSSNTSGVITSDSFNSSSIFFALGNAIGGTNTLPVKMISFNSAVTKTGVVLKWSTASEKNSDYFEIQKSFDANNFFVIGECRAFGNSNNVINYSFLDESNLENVVYYRLKQIDLDGKFEYSKVLIVKSINKSLVSIFPNPAKLDELKFNINNANNPNFNLEIIDLNGNLLFSKKVEVLTKNQNLQLINLKPGSYFMRILNDNLVLNQQIVMIQE